jgi:hypothetical protein
MAILDAFRYSIELMIRRPIVILPALVIIFLTTVVIHALIVFVVSSLLPGYSSLLFDVFLVDLLISLVIGIFLSGFYVAVAKHDLGGRHFSLRRAAHDVQTHRGRLGWIGSTMLTVYAFLIGGAYFAFHFAFHFYVVNDPVFTVLVLAGLILTSMWLYISVLFYEINIVLLVEERHGFDALRRSASMALRGNMLHIFVVMVAVGILYFAVYIGFSDLAHGMTGLTRIVFSYVSLIPDAIVTVIFDVMPAAMYYKHVLNRVRI